MCFSPTPQEMEIQKWFIQLNVFSVSFNTVNWCSTLCVSSFPHKLRLFQYLNDCILLNDKKLIDQSLLIFATLCGSPHIRDDIANAIARLVKFTPFNIYIFYGLEIKYVILQMVSENCLRQTELKLQIRIIFTLSTLSAKRIELQVLVRFWVFIVILHQD